MSDIDTQSIPTQALLAWCRPGFESDCAAELMAHTQYLEAPGYVRASDQAGYVTWHPAAPMDLLALQQQLAFQQLIFVRQWMVVLAELQQLPETDRISPLLDVLPEAVTFRQVMLQTVDTNEGKAMAGFIRKFEKPLLQALQRKMQRQSPWVMQGLLLSSRHIFVGLAPFDNCSPFPGGILRLRSPKEAPSRSTLKLEEAWHCFIGKENFESVFGHGGRAADLGAAPGGWTWQLVKKGFLVDAVDNGPMDTRLMATGTVDHVQMDAFAYEPKQTLDWMVCDIVDKPAKVTDMVCRWVQRGWARRIVFNLKLPMKKRYQEVEKCLSRIDNELQVATDRYQLMAKQLYHDREEITCYVVMDGD